MSELTKEYLDKKLDKLVTKDDLNNGLNLLESNLKLHTEHEVAELARITNNGLNEIKRELDVRAEVDQLKSQMSKVWQALNIKS